MQEVQVEVGRETREGYRTEQIRFTAERQDWYVDDRTEASFTAYRLPDETYRVHVDDPVTPAQTLYPEIDSPGYTAEEVVETWPGFAEAVGKSHVTDVD